MKIPVVVVDDEKVDRYLVRRYFSKVDDFGELIEIESGDKFIEKYYGESSPEDAGDYPTLVLMDINMPGRDGFETAVEAQKLASVGKGPQSLIIMMFTSSDNSEDRRKAEEINLIKGYVTKPLNIDGVSYIRDVYSSLVRKDLI